MDASVTRPLIGVSTSEVRIAERVAATPEGEPPQREMALGLRYLRSIEAAGGLPVVMPPLHLDAVKPLLARLDGICLSGGPDLDPEGYAAKPNPHLGPTEPELDMFELAVAAQADETGLPILAICRGMQALNVARGGNLHQHLPELGQSPIEHRQKEPSEQPSHAVRVAADTRLEELLGGRDPDVNSFHHQAVADLGERLVASAWAPDGVIEGIEDRDRPFLVGVQWHAECLAEGIPEQAALFEGLVAAAGGRGSAARGVKAA
jgi:putative glutamine amidotransferase